MNKRASGFTIVELLIVIVVIAILAAITIVAYNGIQNRANDSAVASDAAVIRKKMELSKIDLGHYPSNETDLPDLRISRSAYDDTNQNVIYCYNSATDAYAVGLATKGRKKFYTVTNNGIDSTTPVNTDKTCQAAGLAGWDNRSYGTAGHWSSGDWTTLKWVVN